MVNAGSSWQLGSGVHHTDFVSHGTFWKAPSSLTKQDGFTMSRLSIFSLMTALVSSSVYAAPTRSIETSSRPSQARTTETEASLETIEKRDAVAEARRMVGSQLRDNS